jgi:hypothetical protein
MIPLFSESANNQRGHCAGAAALCHDLRNLRIARTAAELAVFADCVSLGGRGYDAGVARSFDAITFIHSLFFA